MSSFTSYAQNFEDILLWRALKHIPQGRYVDVGAQHPVVDSVSKGFYERGWRGIHFEPVPLYAELLRQDRPDETILQMALSDQDGVLELHVIPDTGLSTAIKAYANHHKERGYEYQTIQVPTQTMKTALASLAGQPVHWLKIDVEGFEEQVLRGWDSDALRPWIIVIEATVPLSTETRYNGADRLLTAAGYQFVYFDGLNRFYVAPEHMELASALRTPPNIFDGAELSGCSGPWCHGLNARHEAVTEQLAAAQASIERVNAEMEGRLERAKADAAARIEQLEVLARQWATRVADANAVAARAEHRAEEAEAQAAAVSHQLQLTLNSPVWRMTAPFRGLRANLREFERTVRKTRFVSGMKQRIKRRKGERLGRSPLHAQQAPQSVDFPAVRPSSTGRYAEWIKGSETRSPATAEQLGSVPVVSFLICGPGSDDELWRTLDSIRAQAHRSWEAIVCLPGKSEEALTSRIAELIKTDSRIVAVTTTSGNGKPDCLQAATTGARGTFVAILDRGDVLAPHALNEISFALVRAPEADIVYSDEDKLSAADRRDAPYFKPSWSPDLLYTFNYFGRLTLLRRSLVVEAGGIDTGAGAAVEWDINLRVSDLAQHVQRIPKVLCHRNAGHAQERPEASTPEAADHRAVIERYWARQGYAAVASTRAEGTQHVTWRIEAPPLVSIIIPTKNKVQLLRTCIDGLLHGTDYAAMEIIVVDTGSDEAQTLAYYEELRKLAQVRIVHFNRKFNYSAACNYGASSAHGDILLFLNNDIEVVSRDWLQEMVRFALRPGVGAVGARLVFPSGELQHAGVGIGIHLCALMYRSAGDQGWGMFGSPDHPRNWLAIMGACQLVRRDVFERVGGFDESYLVAMSDVALCLRIWRAGYRIAYAPEARLVHHEGATRGKTNPVEDVRRIADDIRLLGIDEDPYLHPEIDGDLAIPTLRIHGAPAVRSVLKSRIGVDGSPPVPILTLDLTSDGDCLEIAGLPRDSVIWAPQPAHGVRDIWSAARWCLDLLRSQNHVRARFPRALSAGVSGDFAQWLKTDVKQQLSLPDTFADAVEQLFSEDISAKARRAFLFDTGFRLAIPHGLTPAGQRESFRWFMQHRHESGLRLEEIWWLLWTAAENPALELNRAYLFTPAWQQLYPDGMTIFGRRAFANWFRATYRVTGDWADPAAWPLYMSPARQLRQAYSARQHWRERHPRALEDAQGGAVPMIDWLQSDDAVQPAEVRSWCAQLDRDAVAEELTQLGVNIIAHFCYPSGLRVSAEALVEGLHEVGVSTSLRDVRTDKKDDPQHLVFDGQEDFDITIIHTQPEPFFREAYERADVAERTPRTYRIAYWYWEFDSIPASWEAAAATVDEVWAATEFVAKGLRDRLPIPVRTVFPGVKLGSFQRREREYFGLRPDTFTFLFTFHMMSVMERKNPLGLIRAFQSAFMPHEQVSLVLKTSFGDRHPAQIKELREAAAGSNITIIDQVYSPDEVLSLMDSCDAYVSLHRSEGLGLTMAEAMLMGKPVIATNYSGNVAFMDETNSLPVKYDLVKLGRTIPPYQADFEWAEPSIEHAAQLMRRVYDDQDWAREIGARGKASAEVSLSLKVAGQKAAARLAEIAALRQANGLVRS